MTESQEEPISRLVGHDPLVLIVVHGSKTGANISVKHYEETINGDNNDLVIDDTTDQTADPDVEPEVTGTPTMNRERKINSAHPVAVCNGPLMKPAFDRNDEVTNLHDFEGSRQFGKNSDFLQNEDQMSQDFWCRRFFLFDQLDVPNTPQTLFRSYLVSPFSDNLETGKSYQLSPFDFFARLFAFWRGSIEYEFEYVAGREVTTRLWVCFQYKSISGTEPALDYARALELPGVFIQFDPNCRKFVLDVPYICPDSWCVPQGSTQTYNPVTSYLEERDHYAVMHIWTTDPPSAPQAALSTTTATALNINYRGGEDFQVRRFAPQPFLNFIPYTIPPPPARGVVSTVKGRKTMNATQVPTSDVIATPAAKNTELILETAKIPVSVQSSKPVEKRKTRSARVAPITFENLLDRPIMLQKWSLNPTTAKGELEKFRVWDDFDVPALAYLRGVCALWRGNLRLSFKVVTSGWNGGMVQVAFVPGWYDCPSEYGADPYLLSSMPNNVRIDLSSNETTVLEVPYCGQTDWVETDAASPAIWGFVVVQLLNTIQAGSTTAGSQNVVLQMHAQWTAVEAVYRKPIKTCPSVAEFEILETGSKTMLASSTTSMTSHTAQARNKQKPQTIMQVDKSFERKQNLRQLMNRPVMIAEGSGQVQKGNTTYIDVPQPNEIDLTTTGAGLFGLLRRCFSAFKGDVEYIAFIRTQETGTVNVAMASYTSIEPLLDTASLTPMLPTPLLDGASYITPARLLDTFAAKPSQRNYTVSSCVPTILANAPTTLHVSTPFLSSKRFTYSSPGNGASAFVPSNQARTVLAVWGVAENESPVDFEYQIFMIIPESASLGLFTGLPILYPDFIATFSNATPPVYQPGEGVDYPGCNIYGSPARKQTIPADGLVAKSKNVK